VQASNAASNRTLESTRGLPFPQIRQKSPFRWALPQLDDTRPNPFYNAVNLIPGNDILTRDNVKPIQKIHFLIKNHRGGR